jgi:putative membrane protein
MFYIVRLFIYNTEAGERPEEEKRILRNQFGVMIKRLWLGITWPSAILTLIFGPWMWILLWSTPSWLEVKLLFVILLYGYHFSLHILYREQVRGVFRFSSRQLRIWNELATLLLFAIVFLASVKQAMGWVGGVVGLLALAGLLMAGIRVYGKVRNRKK